MRLRVEGPAGLEQPLPTRRDPAAPTPVRDGIGSSPARPDGALKATGEFAYSSDLWARGMLWGATLRSPHPYARIRSIDVAPALELDGVHAALTHADVPGLNAFGLELKDQPVLASDTVRFEGEPVAVVAAVDAETARRAAAAIAVEYEPLAPLADAREALGDGAVQLHPDGNVVRRFSVRHGDVAAAAERAEVVVSAEYEVGMQDQAFLGPESGLVIPGEDGGVDIYVATQWLHLDGMQVAECLGLPVEKVRMTLAGVGGAFGGREDLSIHVHASMLALRSGRPVKMVYSREESFLGGHVHRHPARMRYEHGATRDGRLVYVKARIVLDGGAYASTSGAVGLTTAVVGAGPYVVPNAELDAWAVYTNNPPCGAMRGFGSVQVCFAHEAQMDRLAAELDMDPVELRLRNAMQTGSELPTGQVIEDRAPVARLLSDLRAMPLPDDGPAVSPAELPGGLANCTHGEGVRRGVGYAVGFKNISFPAGFPDFSTATVKLSIVGGEPVAEVHTAAAEVGQGIVTIQAQIARTELGVDRAFVRTADTTIGMAGGSSASRQTWVTGGAVKAASEAAREAVMELARERLGEVPDDARLDAGHVVDAAGERIVSLIELLGERSVEETREYHPPRQTTPLDEHGQGNVFIAYAFAAHRAVVDVDTELGLVKVVEVATVQDVGKAMNPQALEGQIEGGIAQGLGLALMEELVIERGRALNGSFTDYLIPTTLDMPPVRSVVLELSQPDAPYGVTGAGEPPMISSPAAIAAAVRAATGRELKRIPLRPEAVAGVS